MTDDTHSPQPADQPHEIKLDSLSGENTAPAPAPAPVVEAPAPVVEAPAPVVEAPAPVMEAPAPVMEAPAAEPTTEQQGQATGIIQKAMMYKKYIIIAVAVIAVLAAVIWVIMFVKGLGQAKDELIDLKDDLSQAGETTAEELSNIVNQLEDQYGKDEEPVFEDAVLEEIPADEESVTPPSLSGTPEEDETDTEDLVSR